MQKRMIDDIERVLLSREQLHARVCQLAAQIERDYEGKDLVMVCVLNGAAVFYIDLLMEMDIPLEMNFIRVSSYGSGTKSSGRVRILDLVFADSCSMICVFPPTLTEVTVRLMVSVPRSKSMASHLSPSTSPRRKP